MKPKRDEPRPQSPRDQSAKLEPETFPDQAVVNEFGEGIDADAEMAIHEFGVHAVVARRGRLLASTKSCQFKAARTNGRIISRLR
jgi:hypothetical protein